jgi:tRNA modification GTPase
LVELENDMGAEFVAMYLKEALVSLQKILGQVYDDQIMDRVFKEFCLGK